MPWPDCEGGLFVSYIIAFSSIHIVKEDAMIAEYQSGELARDSTRKRAARLLEDKPMIQGSLSEFLRTCGTPGCRCHHGGAKHAAVYLAIRHGKKRTSVFVPQSVLPYVQECVANHQHIQQALDIISRDCIEIFLSKKRAGKKKSRQ
jgi:hypothetical protein